MTKLTLVLAHGPEQPDGDVEDRLVLDLGLTAQGLIDLASYDEAASPWLATQLNHGLAPRYLEVTRIDDGWALQSTASEDDPICPFEGHVYRPGELVSLRRSDGQQMLYRIVASEAR